MTMKPVTTRIGRGVAAAMLATTLVAMATAAPTHAATNTPTKGALAAGPNCEGGSHFWWSSSAYPISTGGDYTGHEVYGINETDSCNASSEYIWTGPTGVDTTWVWAERTGVGDLSVADLDCYVWVYIPSDWHWLFWPGHNIDQNTTTGWVYLGQHQVCNYPDIAVTLTNKDTAGWEIGAGSVAFDCVQ